MKKGKWPSEAKKRSEAKKLRSVRESGSVTKTISFGTTNSERAWLESVSSGGQATYGRTIETRTNESGTIETRIIESGAIETRTIETRTIETGAVESSSRKSGHFTGSIFWVTFKGDIFWGRAFKYKTFGTKTISTHASKAVATLC
ncbi:hypothetical protein ACHAPE_007866 [Trichoderma viride]